MNLRNMCLFVISCVFAAFVLETAAHAQQQQLPTQARDTENFDDVAGAWLINQKPYDEGFDYGAPHIFPVVVIATDGLFRVWLLGKRCTDFYSAEYDSNEVGKQERARCVETLIDGVQDFDGPDAVLAVKGRVQRDGTSLSLVPDESYDWLHTRFMQSLAHSPFDAVRYLLIARMMNHPLPLDSLAISIDTGSGETLQMSFAKYPLEVLADASSVAYEGVRVYGAPRIYLRCIADVFLKQDFLSKSMSTDLKESRNLIRERGRNSVLQMIYDEKLSVVLDDKSLPGSERDKLFRKYADMGIALRKKYLALTLRVLSLKIMQAAANYRLGRFLGCPDAKAMDDENLALFPKGVRERYRK